jgi:hypothetical protein
MLIEEANKLFRDHCTYGSILRAYLFTPRTYQQKKVWNEFVDKFKLLPIGVQDGL